MCVPNFIFGSLREFSRTCAGRLKRKGNHAKVQRTRQLIGRPREEVHPTQSYIKRPRRFVSLSDDNGDTNIANDKAILLIQ